MSLWLKFEYTVYNIYEYNQIFNIIYLLSTYFSVKILKF